MCCLFGSIVSLILSIIDVFYKVSKVKKMLTILGATINEVLISGQQITRLIKYGI